MKFFENYPKSAEIRSLQKEEKEKDFQSFEKHEHQ